MHPRLLIPKQTQAHTYLTYQNETGMILHDIESHSAKWNEYVDISDLGFPSSVL